MVHAIIMAAISLWLIYIALCMTGFVAFKSFSALADFSSDRERDRIRRRENDKAWKRLSPFILRQRRFKQYNEQIRRKRQLQARYYSIRNSWRGFIAYCNAEDVN